MSAITGSALGTVILWPFGFVNLCHFSVLLWVRNFSCLCVVDVVVVVVFHVSPVGFMRCDNYLWCTWTLCAAGQ